MEHSISIDFPTILAFISAMMGIVGIGLSTYAISVSKKALEHLKEYQRLTEEIRQAKIIAACDCPACTALKMAKYNPCST